MKIVISCDETKCHDWMAFAAWYSINKNLPDAEVTLVVNRGPTVYFNWANKCQVPIIRKNKATKLVCNDLVLPPYIAAVRNEEEIGPISSKSNNYATIVNYEEGCGSFVTSDWINRNDVPFRKAMKRFTTETMTVNEVAILSLWDRLDSVYKFL